MRILAAPCLIVFACLPSWLVPTRPRTPGVSLYYVAAIAECGGSNVKERAKDRERCSRVRPSDWTDPQPASAAVCLVSGGPSSGLGGRADAHRAEMTLPALCFLVIFYFFFVSGPARNIHNFVLINFAPFSSFFAISPITTQGRPLRWGGEDISQRMKSTKVFRLVDAVPATLPLLV